MMAVARTLLEFGVTDRNLHLFDTFEGMSPPTLEDVSFRGESASDLLSKSTKESSWVWAYSALDEVKRNLHTTGYPTERTFFIKGKVEETIPEYAPPPVKTNLAIYSSICQTANRRWIKLNGPART